MRHEIQQDSTRFNKIQDSTQVTIIYHHNIYINARYQIERHQSFPIYVIDAITESIQILMKRQHLIHVV